MGTILFFVLFFEKKRIFGGLHCLTDEALET